MKEYTVTYEIQVSANSKEEAANIVAGIIAEQITLTLGVVEFDNTADEVELFDV